MRAITFVAAIVLAFMILAAVAAPVLTPYSYEQQNVAKRLLPPGPRHWLGTDNFGRDTATRLAYGGRVSLGIGFSVVLATVAAGTLVGLLAGLRGGWVDTLLMRFTDGLFAFPDILLAILIIGVAGPGIVTVVVALTAVGWPAMARLVRGQTLGLKEALFVRAAVASGASERHIVTRHLLPHLVGVILAAATVDMAGVILAESALSFLGIGVRPPTPSWGALISTGREFMRTNWLLVFLPCTALSLTVISLNLLGDALKERWGQ
jgi:ABC-type dipeptide/oligopeptide/nickel transport system permease subunit